MGSQTTKQVANAMSAMSGHQGRAVVSRAERQETARVSLVTPNSVLTSRKKYLLAASTSKLLPPERLL
jgi:hypothetical protein